MGWCSGFDLFGPEYGGRPPFHPTTHRDAHHHPIFPRFIPNNPLMCIEVMARPAAKAECYLYIAL